MSEENEEHLHLIIMNDKQMMEIVGRLLKSGEAEKLLRDAMDTIQALKDALEKYERAVQ